MFLVLGKSALFKMLFLILSFLLLLANADERRNIGAIGILYVEAKDGFEAV